MKTDRFLLLAASLVLAMAFTLSCSGDDGKDGKDGTNGEDGKDGVDCSLDVDDNGTVTQSCGTKTVIISCGGSPFNSKTQICDARDGQAYKFVTISGKDWLAENVKYKADGSICYDDLKANCEKYGRLYDWTTAQGACPVGWKLPAKAEWEALVAFAGVVDAGEKLKSEEAGGTDELGFGALLGGYKSSDYQNEGSIGRFWSTTDDDDLASSLEISDNASLGNRPKTNMNSVRCLKD
jgi:uncharacterized protein (TIGR02145 family)